jgi:hypothetical protein
MVNDGKGGMKNRTYPYTFITYIDRLGVMVIGHEKGGHTHGECAKIFSKHTPYSENVFKWFQRIFKKLKHSSRGIDSHREHPKTWNDKLVIRIG